MRLAKCELIDCGVDYSDDILTSGGFLWARPNVGAVLVCPKCRQKTLRMLELTGLENEIVIFCPVDEPFRDFCLGLIREGKI